MICRHVQGAEEEAGESDADDYGMELDDQDEVSIRDVSIRPTTGKKSKKKGKAKGKAAKPKGRRNVGGFSEFITSDKARLHDSSRLCAVSLLLYQLPDRHVCSVSDCGCPW